jgi:predicted pyridoxine 5'-phosphate oxidase superfamily flavin-nucleotide-binding protein
MLTEDMRRVVEEQKLGYVATVCPDGTPNLSPKGTTAVWDDDHLVFADIRSPQTVANLRANPAVEVNVVDPIVRKGYRFKGTAVVLEDGERFTEIVAWYRGSGVTSPIRAVVLMKVHEARPLISPSYDGGATEETVRRRWQDYYFGEVGWDRRESVE